MQRSDVTVSYAVERSADLIATHGLRQRPAACVDLPAVLV